MYYQKIFVGLLAMWFLCTAAHATSCQQHIGTELTLHCMESNIKKDLFFAGKVELYHSELHGKLTVHGPTLLFNTQIAKKTEIHGVLLATSSRLQALILVGHARLVRCDFRGPVTQNGALYAEDVHFHKELQVTTHRVEFHKTRAKTLQFIAAGAESGTARLLELRDHSEIDEDVIFPSGSHGIVRMDRTSSVKGKVIHGYQVHI